MILPGKPGLAVASLLLAAAAAADENRLFDIDTYLSLESLAGVTVSPDGEFVAYTVSGNNLESDSGNSAVWMQPAAGGEPLRMTSPESSAWSPQWSPDNRYLAVMSARADNETQVWLLDRRGGDAQQLTEFKQGVRSFEWSADGKRMLLQVQDPSPADLDEEERPNPRPWVIDRVQFKRDYVGYLDNRRTHIYVLELADQSTRQVTFGPYDDSQATWSPDGEHIVFVSNRTEFPDENRNTDLWRIDVTRDRAEPEQLTDAEYADSNPVFSPDGKRIVYTSASSDSLPVYTIPQLAVLDLETGRSVPVESLAEVQAWGMQFSRDGDKVLAIIEYRGDQQLVRLDLASGTVERLIDGPDVVLEFDVSATGQVFTRVSRPTITPEIYRLDGDGLQPLSSINRELLADIDLGKTEKHSYTARDGVELDTFVVFPPDYKAGRTYPGVLKIHGGPWSQDNWAFDYEAQLLAAQGYVVVMPNFRGSWGYGQAFTDALIGKWGEADYNDVMDAMDFAIDEGWIDGDRMATMGWSWGGYLTNHVITKTDRFKAAISGASETLMMANYGHDEWQRLWHEELGPPWLEENRAAWDRVSPFFSIDKVTTPTLIVGGEADWNMPIINSEQLYIGLKRRGIPTLLVVYPGQGHSLSPPSYERDLYERYFDWFNKYLAN
ncbi:MAG: S9 family peptidase [Gammaproteobacteria bacterium]|nr:S9 family peptidase [Gammaproteobacteria bacterium]